MTRDPMRCPWCGDNCPRFGLETCPFRPRQIPREPKQGAAIFMSNPAIQLFCVNSHSMDRGADWCGMCGLPPAKVPPNRAQDSAGQPIGVGDTVTWRGPLYTIKEFSEAVGRCGTRLIVFEEPLHTQDFVPDEIGVDLVETAP